MPKDRKVRIDSPGSFDKLNIVTAERRAPGDNEVEVEVAASGVNFADCFVRMGVYKSAKEYVGWPITPGFEYSGTVARVGKSVTRFRSGDKVLGVSLFGGYSSCVTVEEKFLYACPSFMTLEEAATFPVVFLTAYFPLFEQMRVRSGSTVLIHSAAGGVGSALVQLCKAIGCYVVGVVGSTQKVSAVKEFGADVVIDKSNQDLWKVARSCAPKGFDLVFDANGVETLGRSYKNLAPAGRLVVYGFHTMFSRTTGKPNWAKLAVDFVRTPRFDPFGMTSDNKSVLAFNLSYLFDREEIFRDGMDLLLRYLNEKKIKPLAVTTYPAEEVGKAHALLESGKSIGKIALRWS